MKLELDASLDVSRLYSSFYFFYLERKDERALYPCDRTPTAAQLPVRDTKTTAELLLVSLAKRYV